MIALKLKFFFFVPTFCSSSQIFFISSWIIGIKVAIGLSCSLWSRMTNSSNVFEEWLPIKFETKKKKRRENLNRQEGCSSALKGIWEVFYPQVLFETTANWAQKLPSEGQYFLHCNVPNRGATCWWAIFRRVPTKTRRFFFRKPIVRRDFQSHFLVQYVTLTAWCSPLSLESTPSTSKIKTLSFVPCWFCDNDIQTPKVVWERPLLWTMTGNVVPKSRLRRVPFFFRNEWIFGTKICKCGLLFPLLWQPRIDTMYHWKPRSVNFHEWITLSISCFSLFFVSKRFLSLVRLGFWNGLEKTAVWRWRTLKKKQTRFLSNSCPYMNFASLSMIWTVSKNVFFIKKKPISWN